MGVTVATWAYALIILFYREKKQSILLHSEMATMPSAAGIAIKRQNRRLECTQCLQKTSHVVIGSNFIKL